MRVQPVGLLDIDSDSRAGLAQLQAALTHGHPTALAAADLTAFAIASLLEGASPARLPETLRSYAESQRAVYQTKWLGDLWKRSAPSPEAYISHGLGRMFGRSRPARSGFRET